MERQLRKNAQLIRSSLSVLSIEAGSLGHHDTISHPARSHVRRGS
jgi:hypothetical protein